VVAFCYQDVMIREIRGRYKVLSFLILREKCQNSRADWSDKSERYCRQYRSDLSDQSALEMKTSGSIKERTQTSSERGIGCQRNGHWAATNHLSGRGLVQPIKELSSAAGRGVRKRGCALIRQLGNCTTLTL